MDLDRPKSLARRVKLGPLGTLPEVPFNVRTLAEAGVIRPMRPDKLARVVGGGGGGGGAEGSLIQTTSV
jgi:hypothetical protein